MTKPPLYSRAGATSPMTGEEIGGSLLAKAQEFSAFAVQHVEEVRQALVRTSDAGGGGFGHRNGPEIAAAFKELAAAYDKLSSLKWDAMRVEFEALQRAQANVEHPNQGDGKSGKHVTMAGVTNAKEVAPGAQGVKAHPWQEEDEQLDHWISNAFLKGAIAEEDEEGDAFPINGGLASFNATTGLFPSATAKAPTPPGFNDANGAAQTRLQSLTSIQSDISSLHTTSHPGTDEDGDDDESEYSDSSSVSEDLPPLERFDYVYKGGYAMQVSGGKETKGVVPKTVKQVLVDPSAKMIEEGAFQGCNALQSITIPSTIEGIGDHAFRKCAKLKSVTFLTRTPKSRRAKHRDEKKEEQSFRRSTSAPPSFTEPPSSKLRSIGEWAFFNCSSLGGVKLPYGLESIGERAFQRCSSMAIYELPKTLTSVGEHAFVGCPRETKTAYDRWVKTHSN